MAIKRRFSTFKEGEDVHESLNAIKEMDNHQLREFMRDNGHNLCNNPYFCRVLYKYTSFKNCVEIFKIHRPCSFPDIVKYSALDWIRGVGEDMASVPYRIPFTDDYVSILSVCLQGDVPYNRDELKLLTPKGVDVATPVRWACQGVTVPLLYLMARQYPLDLFVEVMGDDTEAVNINCEFGYACSASLCNPDKGVYDLLKGLTPNFSSCEYFAYELLSCPFVHMVLDELDWDRKKFEEELVKNGFEVYDDFERIDLILDDIFA